MPGESWMLRDKNLLFLKDDSAGDDITHHFGDRRRAGEPRAFDADDVYKAAEAVSLFDNKVSVSPLGGRGALGTVAGEITDKVAHLNIW